MKSVVIFFAFIASVLCTNHSNDDLMQKMTVNLESCIRQSRADPKLVEDLIKDSKFVADDKLKCFIKCIYITTGIMSETGEVNVEELRKSLEESQPKELADKCKDLEGTDLCDTAYLVAKCADS